MSGAHYQINQAANPIPTGTEDVARIDIWEDRALHLVGDSSDGQLSPAWTITAWPDGSARAQPTNATTFDATYTPDVPGSYKVEFLVDDGLDANKTTFIFAVTRDTNGLIYDDGIREPAFGETVGDDNVGGNDRGYAKPIEVGMAAQTPVVATVAVLQTRRPNRHKQVRTQSHSGQNKGGALFVWDETSTATHIAGIRIQPGNGTAAAMTTGRWLLQFAGAVHGEWFGIKADGRVILDGELTASDNTFESSTAVFTLADQGKRIVYRTPSLPSTNPVTLTSGSQQITGLGLNTDFGVLTPPSGVPVTGGGIVALEDDSGEITYRAVLVTASDTQAVLFTAAPVVDDATSVTLYLETSQIGFVKYISATEIEIYQDSSFITPVNSIFSETDVPAFMATDDTDAILAFVNAVVSLGSPEALLPKGLIGLSSNLKWTDVQNLNLRGHGRDLTVLCDLRRPSFERSNAVVEANDDHGALSFFGGNNIHLWDMSYDANLHTVGMTHSTGGLTNHSGGRVGFFMRGVENPGFHRLGSMGGLGGFGARDEHIYHDTGCTNAIIEDCVCGDALHPTNGPTFNPVSGDGTRVQNNVGVSHFAALECTCESPIITGNHFSNYSVYPTGAPPVIVSCRGRVIFCHNHVRDTDTSTGTVAALDFQEAQGHNCVLMCSHNVLSDLFGLFGPAGGIGVINIHNLQGTAYITNNVGDGIGSRSDYPDGRFINVSGALSSGKIYIGANAMHPSPETNDSSYMSTGISVAATVPRFLVTILPGNEFAGCENPYAFATAVDVTREFGEMRLGQYIEDDDQTILVGDYSDTFTAVAATNLCTTDNTSLLINGNELSLTTTGALPGGLFPNRPYYVRDVSGDTFKLSETRGGAAVDITSTGTNTQTLHRAGGYRFVLPEATLTTDREVTIDPTGLTEKRIVRIERRDATVHDLTITNGGPGAGSWVIDPLNGADFVFDGTDLELAGYVEIY